MSFSLFIPSQNSSAPFTTTVEPGSSAIFVGANGGGKTRLAVYIEKSFLLNAHRISAHRALNLNPNVPKIDEKSARRGLKTGVSAEYSSLDHRPGNRWQSKEAVYLLNDFDFLIQTLFAQQANSALETHKRNRLGDNTLADPNKLELLTDIWERLLPHRILHITGDDIEVSPAGSVTTYNGSEMSDGERAIFYMIGQTLVADDNSLLIIDEPELHVHRAIMGKLWDELEAARSDCAFIFITHDLEFAASRVAQKFVIRNYSSSPSWTIEAVPTDTGFDEETTTLILGSRRPVLFIEGQGTSLDIAIYRCCYPQWTVIPRGSCEEVIHSVVTMRRNQALTRVTCSGIVDADDYDPDDVAKLAALRVATLPVSEIENIILLPSVSMAIAEIEGYAGADLGSRLLALQKAVFLTLGTARAVEDFVVRYCRRRIDRTLKKVDLSSADTVQGVSTLYGQKVSALNISVIAQAAEQRINTAIASQDLPALLAAYDNKGLMALAASHLKSSKMDAFEGWLLRALRSGKQPALVAAISAILPTITPE